MSIPRKHSERVVFASNINKTTAAFSDRFGQTGAAYLLSERYATKSLRELALLAGSNGRLIFADNGNFSRMQKIADKFLSRGQMLVAQAEAEIESTGAIEDTTKIARADLIRDVDIACKSISQSESWSKIIERQVSFNPSIVIGLEDLTIPVLHMLGIFDRKFEFSTKDVLRFQKRNIEMFSQGRKGKFGFRPELDKTSEFIVLHALDFSSARQASRLAKAASPAGVAISYGAPMASRRWIKSVSLGRKVINFDPPIPEQYISAHAMTLGFLAGGIGDAPVHILGLGSPILIAMTTRLLGNQKAISFDSTAPFKDSDAGTIYGDWPALLKFDMYKLAASCLLSGKPFQSKAKCFVEFDRDHPANWVGLRNELNLDGTEKRNVLAKLLKANPDLLLKFIPFFSTTRGVFGKRVNLARSGHNLFVLEKICKKANSLKDDHVAFNKWIDFEVDRYLRVASPDWARAVNAARDLERRFRMISD